MKRINWIGIFVAPLLFLLIARFCHHKTDGFKMTKIYNNCLETNPENTPFPTALRPILKQKFTYLGRGKQSFAFLSADQTTVLKLFNNRYQRRIFWRSHLPFLGDGAHYFQTKLQKLRASYSLVEKALKQETALLYLHQAPSTHLNRSVTIVDKLGIAHTISLDTTGFALQKTGIPAYRYLEELIKQGKTQETLDALQRIIELIVKRCQLGVADNDPLIRTNLGFIDGAPFYIDLGPFSFNPTEKIEAVWKPEVQKITTGLRHFLEQNYPLLVPTFQEMIPP